MKGKRFPHRNSAGADRRTKSNDYIGFDKEAFTYDICGEWGFSMAKLSGRATL